MSPSLFAQQPMEKKAFWATSELLSQDEAAEPQRQKCSFRWWAGNVHLLKAFQNLACTSFTFMPWSFMLGLYFTGAYEPANSGTANYASLVRICMDSSMFSRSSCSSLMREPTWSGKARPARTVCVSSVGPPTPIPLPPWQKMPSLKWRLEARYRQCNPDFPNRFLRLIRATRVDIFSFEMGRSFLTLEKSSFRRLQTFPVYQRKSWRGRSAIFLQFQPFTMICTGCPLSQVQAIHIAESVAPGKVLLVTRTFVRLPLHPWKSQLKTAEKPKWIALVATLFSNHNFLLLLLCGKLMYFLYS